MCDQNKYLCGLQVLVKDAFIITHWEVESVEGDTEGTLYRVRSMKAGSEER